MRRTGTPEASAARSLPPTARSRRPKVERSMITHATRIAPTAMMIPAFARVLGTTIGSFASAGTMSEAGNVPPGTSQGPSTR